MDVIQTFLNFAVPPLGLFFLILVWPMLLMLSAFQSVITFFWQENVRGKVVLITGASSGIGEHVAYEYAKKGAILVLVARRDDRLRNVAERCRNLGATEVRTIRADVTSEEDCKRFIDETINQFGHLNHLVNNSGMTHSSLFEETSSTTAFKRVLDITFWGHVYPTFYALPHLRRTGGKIIENASVAAWLPLPRLSAYNAAKAAAFNFFETLLVEVGPEIGITIVTPGWIESEMTKGKFVSDTGDEAVDEERRDVVVGSWPVAYAEECAKAMVHGALRGQRYVRIPYWYTVFLLYRVFAPEMVDWFCRLFYISHLPGAESPPSKVLAETAGAKKLLHPSTIQKSE